MGTDVQPVGAALRAEALLRAGSRVLETQVFAAPLLLAAFDLHDRGVMKFQVPAAAEPEVLEKLRTRYFPRAVFARGEGNEVILCEGIRKTSLDFFIRHQASVEELLTPTGLDGLKLIGGQAGVLGLANPKYSQKLRFINQLKRLEADFVLLDLGAGAMYDVLDFFLSCDRGILVTCPTPLAVKYTFG